ncbi:Aquaporin-like protein [Glarea lozoyensis ATCC 20868]|uniref:Aquaporin-like protein n=2 Tax=Glarea lozoyensis TaxID=101852 RepID=S3D4A7_GLAL2|nr:Aquaporin-like protein [Glarea lozoyensis ATCC 20868]EPE26906.1 Aquaporin-like protein [Glarea lozoyensis ATCC 20868]
MADRSGSIERPRSLDKPRGSTTEDNASSSQEPQTLGRPDFSILPSILETKTPPMSRAPSIAENNRIAPMIQETAPTPQTEEPNPFGDDAEPVNQDEEDPRVTHLSRAGTSPVPPRSARSPTTAFPLTTRPRGRTESSRNPSIRSRPISPHSQNLRRQASSIVTSPGLASQDYSLDRRESEVSHSRRQRPRANTASQAFVSPGLTKRGTWATVSRNRGNSIRRRPTVVIASGRDADSQSIPGDFSLAGPPPVEVLASNQPYVDPGYAELNPAYDQPPNTRPVWGLAGPLPRVVRPGMIPTRSELNLGNETGNEKVDEDEHPDLEQGRIEPTFRLDRISSQLQSARQRREENLMRTYSRTNSFAPSVTSPITPSGRINPSIDVALDEQDPNLTKLQSIQEIPPSNEPQLYPDDASTTTTEHEHDHDHEHDGFDDDGHWVEDYEIKPNYGMAEDEIHNLHTHWSVIRLRFREPLAELLAVIVQLTLGFCANLAVTTSNGSAGVADTTCWAWGLATMVAIYIAGGISGAHLNPAISLMLYIYRGFPLRKIPIYVFAQLLGAFIAALIAFGVFRADIVNYGGANLATGHTLSSFITYPRHVWIDASTAFFTEFTATSILAVAVLALGDDANAPPGAGMSALIIGLLITVLSMAFGYNTGCAMNPARDLGPRLAVLALGYGGGNTFGNSYWVWGPWCATISGAIFGAFLYDALIFVGGESPVNYPRKRIKRAGTKWKRRWAGRIKNAKKKMKSGGVKA